MSGNQFALHEYPGKRLYIIHAGANDLLSSPALALDKLFDPTAECGIVPS
jgi:hypothetical protein